MSEEDKLEEKINITLKKLELVQRHKENVIKNCDIVGKKLIESGEIQLGLNLIANSYSHDDCKLKSPFQFEYLFQDKDKEMLKLAVQEHNTTCDHHLNFYEDIHAVPVVKIAEIVCDLAARSSEQGSSLKDYLENIYFPKHGIKKNSNLDKQIKKFVNLLLEEKFKKL